jgi:hypothetical protein
VARAHDVNANQVFFWRKHNNSRIIAVIWLEDPIPESVDSAKAIPSASIRAPIVYKDLCLAITSPAIRGDGPITDREFQTLNQCLSRTISGSISEYADAGKSKTATAR